MGTVGISPNVEHVAPAPGGRKVRCETGFVKVDGRKLDFKVEVYDDCDLIGKGTHSRFIVKNDKFQIKANGKLGKA